MMQSISVAGQRKPAGKEWTDSLGHNIVPVTLNKNEQNSITDNNFLSHTFSNHNIKK